MSQSYRNPYQSNPRSTDSGGGCGIVLVIIGVAIFLLAAAVLLFISFFTIQSAEVQPQIEEMAPVETFQTPVESSTETDSSVAPPPAQGTIIQDDAPVLAGGMRYPTLAMVHMNEASELRAHGPLP